MNQGEFYVYSPDGAITGIDTIKVQGGRFAYEIPCEDKGTIVIVREDDDVAKEHLVTVS